MYSDSIQFSANYSSRFAQMPVSNGDEAVCHVNCLSVPSMTDPFNPQVGQRVLLKKFQLSHNRSLDGVLNFLNSANMTEAGPAHLLGDASNSASGAASTALPGAARGGLSGKRQTLPEIRCKSVRFSPTGRSWAAATTEGLVVYSLRDDATFTPFELTEEITPATVALLSRTGSHGKALLVALHLSEPPVPNAPRTS